jgi:hypothetical protein
MELVSTGHQNPFGGKCVHGVDGAFLHRGSQVNPNCDGCQKDGRVPDHTPVFVREKVKCRNENCGCHQQERMAQPVRPVDSV